MFRSMCPSNMIGHIDKKMGLIEDFVKQVKFSAFINNHSENGTVKSIPLQVSTSGHVRLT